jgi:hypothetical protein
LDSQCKADLTINLLQQEAWQLAALEGRIHTLCSCHTVKLTDSWIDTFALSRMMSCIVSSASLFQCFLLTADLNSCKLANLQASRSSNQQ